MIETASPSNDPTLDDVRRFWDANPLWTGEAGANPGSPEFFRSHTEAVLGMIGGKVPGAMWPAVPRDEPILDLGCGPGFWLEQFGLAGYRNLVGADLSAVSLALARQRCEHHGIAAQFKVENAQSMSFPEACFAHVNCTGVIHHSPDPPACVREIARVLRPGGTACITVYYRNVALRLWPALRPLARLAGRAGMRMRGRGREDMFSAGSASELVRRYDGADNPIGVAYSRSEFKAMLGPYFEIRRVFGHALPERVLPIRLPPSMFRVLEKVCPFLICAIVVKR